MVQAARDGYSDWKTRCSDSRRSVSKNVLWLAAFSLALPDICFSLIKIRWWLELRFLGSSVGPSRFRDPKLLPDLESEEQHDLCPSQSPGNRSQMLSVTPWPGEMLGDAGIPSTKSCCLNPEYQRWVTQLEMASEHYLRPKLWTVQVQHSPGRGYVDDLYSLFSIYR